MIHRVIVQVRYCNLVITKWAGSIRMRGGEGASALNKLTRVSLLAKILGLHPGVRRSILLRETKVMSSQQEIWGFRSNITEPGAG